MVGEVFLHINCWQCHNIDIEFEIVGLQRKYILYSIPKSNNPNINNSYCLPNKTSIFHPIVQVFVAWAFRPNFVKDCILFWLQSWNIVNLFQMMFPWYVISIHYVAVFPTKPNHSSFSEIHHIESRFFFLFPSIRSIRFLLIHRIFIFNIS